MKNDALGEIRREDGTIAVRKVFENGKLFTRHYHENGQLAVEYPRVGNLVDGIVRQWDDNGRLLGSYSLTLGCGVAKVWCPDGTLQFETEMLDGLPCGLMRSWDETDALLGERLFYLGRPISRVKYHKISARNPRLPKH